MTPNKEEIFLKYAQEIRNAYYENSRIPVLATIRREENIRSPDFLKIGKEFLIPEEFFDPDHVIITRPFADFVELSEFQYIIGVLNQTSDRKTQCCHVPDYSTINSAIEAISGITTPDFIVIPIAFFVGLHSGSVGSGAASVRYESDNHPYYVGSGSRLRILWSNKYIKLNEILIGSSRDSFWLFKSNDDDRLWVEFKDLRQTKVSLLVETKFKYLPPPADKISVVEFPDRLCQIQS